MVSLPQTAGAPATSVGDRIATEAVAMATAKQFATYASPPKSDAAFDCSYFVWLVLKQINPAYVRHASSAITQDTALFQLVSGPPQAGDIVYFPAGTVPHEVSKKNMRTFPAHVAIMLSATQFVGMQSHGTGTVNVPDLWWWQRPKSFYRYVGPAQ